MDYKLSKREAIVRRIGSVVVAVGVALFLGLYMIPNAMVDFSIGMPVMVASSAIGAAIYYLTIKRRPIYFWMGQFIFALIMAVLAFFAVGALSDNASNLLTCRVCGYKTLTVEDGQCLVCGSRTTKAEAGSQGYDNVDHFIMQQQMLFFAPKDSSQSVDFSRGAPEGSPYLKDSNWKPLVTKEDVLYMRDAADSLQRK
jgi:hypothetical protein